jgi:hypothetical protein
MPPVEKVLYCAQVTATAGRDIRVMSSDGGLEGAGHVVLGSDPQGSTIERMRQLSWHSGPIELFAQTEKTLHVLRSRRLPAEPLS